MLLTILGTLMGPGIHSTVARVKRNGILVGIAVFFLLTAYVLAVTAGTIWLAHIYGPVEAALFLAACAVLIAIVMFIIMAIFNARDARRARERKAVVQSAAALGLSFIRGQPLLTAGILAALVAANLIGKGDDD
ncbi:hypothetical protein [Oryzifoliimicrobium ureilyticus]|uniref:hypothetical protein n=1 Tax=Oryzifoliimicrobium ureilyticus TaxID=3113724 RepID=UPI0030764131